MGGTGPGARAPCFRAVVFDDLLAAGAPGELPEGARVVVVDRAEDAVAVVLRERPHVVLMDFEMNGETLGDEAIRDLRVAFPGTRLRILAISASSHGNARMLVAGADGTLSKGRVWTWLREQAIVASILGLELEEADETGEPG